MAAAFLRHVSGPRLDRLGDELEAELLGHRGARHRGIATRIEASTTQGSSSDTEGGGDSFCGADVIAQFLGGLHSDGDDDDTQGYDTEGGRGNVCNDNTCDADDILVCKGGNDDSRKGSMRPRRRGFDQKGGYNEVYGESCAMKSPQARGAEDELLEGTLPDDGLGATGRGSDGFGQKGGYNEDYGESTTWGADNPLRIAHRACQRVRCC